MKGPVLGTKSRPRNVAVKAGKAPFLKLGLAVQMKQKSFTMNQSGFPVQMGVRGGIVSSCLAPGHFLMGIGEEMLSDVFGIIAYEDFR